MSIQKIDMAETSVGSLPGKLSNTQGIKDVEIKKAPIEQVIAELYRQWCEK